MRARPTYQQQEPEPSYEHPVDQMVRRRVKRRDLQRTADEASTAIVKALGRRRRLWFTYEAAADALRAKREAAYYDVGVEHGIEACAVHGLGRPSKRVRANAQYVMRELLRTGVARQEALRTMIVTAWGLLTGKTATQSEHAAR